MRRLPPPISTPLYTRSYACALAVARSPRSSLRGAVKGWCSASRRPSSSLNSNIGKSVTHVSACRSSTSPRVCATNCRTRSRALFATASLSAMSRIRSPSAAPAASSSLAVSSGENPSRIGLAASSSPPAATRAKARPLAPPLIASAATSPLGGFRREFEILLPSGTTHALTTPPSATHPEKTLNPHPATAAETSLSSSAKRVSGLSQPYLPMASSYVMRGKGVGRSTPSTSLKIALTRSSCSARMVSWSANASSMSSCVNSGCRSARRSSSRKHLAIW
mmetsp:Transcript_22825/g.70934  ORF Transcript_22825/g.70934 Transcript_22825/m.70934 type:complete len:279 (-) Transcript_22825:561-1397(-)